MPNPTHQLEALDSKGHGLRTVFTRTGDRFAETILAVTATGEAPLLHSDASAVWQEIVPHILPDSRQALLLTGAGEGRYWSATIAPISDVHFPLLGYDLACRRRDASMPAIAYHIPSEVTVTERDDCVVLAVDGREFMLRGAAMPNSLATEAVETSRLHLHGRQIRIEAIAAPHISTRETVQWRFELSAIPPR